MLGDQRAMLPSMFDDLNVGITVHDPVTGDILDVNERLERLYGYSADELRQMDVEEYTAPSTKFTQQKAVEQIRAAASGDPQNFEWQIERANGELRWVRVTLSATSIDGRECVVAEIYDITNYRKREQRLRLLSRILRHNLRNKMTVIQGRAEQLRRALDDERAENAEHILDTAMDVGGLSESVRQIEEIANFETAERSPIDLACLAESAVEDAQADHPEAELAVDVEADVTVSANRGLSYALDQALENAIVHNSSGSPHVSVTVTADDETDQGVVRISDDGPPIPSVETNVLNERVETSSTYHGTGVGLWVMQWCVSSLGGELTFEGGDRGNVVSIALPQATC